MAGDPWQIAPTQRAAPRVAATKATPAQVAAPAPRSSSTGLPCLLLPRPDCRDYGLLDLSIAGGRSHSYGRWHGALRLSTGVGLLVAATPHLHWGPALDLGFDIGGATSGWSAVPKVHGRLWLGETDFTLEGSIGSLFERYSFKEGYETRNRVGAAADLAFSYHGAASLFGSMSLAADPSGDGGAELRLLIGFRASVIIWGLTALSPFAAQILK